MLDKRIASMSCGFALLCAVSFTTTAAPLPSIPLGADGDCQPAWVPTFGSASGFNDAVHALAVHDGGSGSGTVLYAGGEFTLANGIAMNRIAEWDGGTWSPLAGGMNGIVRALTVFDDGLGGGPMLYAGGTFTVAGGVGVNNIARWNGQQWSPVGDGINGVNGSVYSLAVFDDGSGLALFVGGNFTSAGGHSANRIAKWDGAAWTALGSGIGGSESTVRAMASFHDGVGNAALFVGGSFLSADGVEASNIARWDGASWSSVGGGTNALVRALAVFDDGSGDRPGLIAGGAFESAGDVPANRIAKWDGAAWSPLGSGVAGSVQALAAFDGETHAGRNLYVGGTFANAGGNPATRIAKWNGVEWSPLGSGVTGQIGWVQALAIQDDGSGGPVLVTGGSFTHIGGKSARRIATWNLNAGDAADPNLRWLPVGTGLNHFVRAMTVFDDGSGPALYVGGTFTSAGGVSAGRVAKWDGEKWSSLGSGILNGEVFALAVYDDGSGGGPALYAGGSFTNPASSIAKWDGTSWLPLGSGIVGSIYQCGTSIIDVAGVFDLAVYDDGSGGGPALYAGGCFHTAGGESVANIARWDGAQWSSVGGGASAVVLTLLVLESDHGPGLDAALYAGGSFGSAGGVPTGRVAKWNGKQWSPLDAGPTGSWARTLAIYDDGSGGGPNLYAGGGISGVVTRWNGEQWTAIGSGINHIVRTLAAFDDGLGGQALFAGGHFTEIDGVPADHVARWDGAAWSPLAGGVNGVVRAMAVFDDGTEPALYMGGEFLAQTGAYGAMGESYIAKYQCAAAANNICANAISVSNCVTPFSTLIATTTGPDEPEHCTFFGDGTIQNDIWFRYDATCSGALTISTCGSAYHTKLAVYSETCPTGSGEVIACNVAACQTQAKVIINATQGETFLIRIGGHNGARGNGVLDIICTPIPGDLNGDGVVDVSDLLILLAAWGPCPDGATCPADMNGDGAVDVSDLLTLLANWG